MVRRGRCGCGKENMSGKESEPNRRGDNRVWGACEQEGYKKRQGKHGPNYERLFIAGKALSLPCNCYVTARVPLALHTGNTVPSVPMRSMFY